jgi:hypothetical protein
VKSIDNIPGKKRPRDSDGSKIEEYFRGLSEQDAAQPVSSLRMTVEIGAIPGLKKMGVISYQRPCKTGNVSVYKNLAQPVNKVPIVDLVFKYGLALNPPDNDVVQYAGRIYSGFS